MIVTDLTSYSKKLDTVKRCQGTIFRVDVLNFHEADYNIFLAFTDV